MGIAPRSVPCASAAYVVFDAWPNSDARRMLRRLDAKEVKSDAPDSRFWFRIPFTGARDLQTVERVMRSNGLGKSYGPHAGCGIVMSPTGAGAIPAHAKPRAKRNARFKELETRGAVQFQSVCADVFACAFPDSVAFMAELNAIAWRETGENFAQVKNWLAILDIYLARKLLRAVEAGEKTEAIVDAQARLEKYLAPDGKRVRKSETIKGKGKPIILAPVKRPDCFSHCSELQWWDMADQKEGSGI